MLLYASVQESTLLVCSVKSTLSEQLSTVSLLMMKLTDYIYLRFPLHIKLAFKRFLNEKFVITAFGVVIKDGIVSCAINNIMRQNLFAQGPSSLLRLVAAHRVYLHFFKSEEPEPGIATRTLLHPCNGVCKYDVEKRSLLSSLHHYLHMRARSSHAPSDALLSPHHDAIPPRRPCAAAQHEKQRRARETRPGRAGNERETTNKLQERADALRQCQASA